MNSELLRSELTHYLILANELKAQYQDIDDDTLRDTLEGISNLPDLIQEVVRSSLEDESLQTGLKARIEEMQARLERFKQRAQKKRELVCATMGKAGLERLQAPDFSVSLRQGAVRLEVFDEAKVPEEFLVPQPPRIDKAAISASLKTGKPVPGSVLVQGDPLISVRVR